MGPFPLLAAPWVRKVVPGALEALGDSGRFGSFKALAIPSDLLSTDSFLVGAEGRMVLFHVKHLL